MNIFVSGLIIGLSSFGILKTSLSFTNQNHIVVIGLIFLGEYIAWWLHVKLNHNTKSVFLTTSNKTSQQTHVKPRHHAAFSIEQCSECETVENNESSLQLPHQTSRRVFCNNKSNVIFLTGFSIHIFVDGLVLGISLTQGFQLSLVLGFCLCILQDLITIYFYNRLLHTRTNSIVISIGFGTTCVCGGITSGFFVPGIPRFWVGIVISLSIGFIVHEAIGCHGFDISLKKQRLKFYGGVLVSGLTSLFETYIF